MCWQGFVMKRIIRRNQQWTLTFTTLSTLASEEWQAALSLLSMPCITFVQWWSASMYTFLLCTYISAQCKLISADTKEMPDRCVICIKIVNLETESDINNTNG